MDFINGNQIHGSVATRLMDVNFDPAALRPWFDPVTNRSYITHNGVAVPIQNATTLRKDEWKQMDDTVLNIARERLVGVADLESRGLVYNITNGLGTTVLEYEDVSDMNDAEMDMDAETEGRNDRIQYSPNYLPLPIVHKDFRINIRQLAASRTKGASLDTTQMELSTIKVVKKWEEMLFNGTSSYTFGGGTIYGYLDFPTSVGGTLTKGWDDSAATGSTMVADLVAMKQALINVKHYGPYGVYIPTSFETALDDDYKAASDKTIRQRLLEIEGIDFIKVSDHMTTDYVVMVELQASTVRMVNALPLAPVQWEEKGGMVLKFKVMGIKVPQIRADQDGNCGLAVYAAP
jgi:hypothetical protein